MSLLPRRIGVKFPLIGESQPELEAYVPVFQRWIQEKALDGLLIDVADYRHVQGGPGIILIGHEGDYALDERDGVSGFLYTRKQALGGDLRERLLLAFRLALAGAYRLEAEDSLHGVRFDFRAPLFSFYDRLALPNNPETLNRVEAELQALLRELYESYDISLSLLTDDRRSHLSVSARIRDASVPELLDRFNLRVATPG